MSFKGIQMINPKTHNPKPSKPYKEGADCRILKLYFGPEDNLGEPATSSAA